MYYAYETATNVFLSWKFCRRDDRCNGDGIKLNVAIKLETVAFVAKEWLIERKMMERDFCQLIVVNYRNFWRET